MSGVVGHKEKLLFCQVDANLDSNPKIVAAGGLGAAVFLFVLRRIKVLGTDGWVRARDINPDYLASQLRFSASEMLSGVSAAVRAGLITDIADNGRVHVVGWSEEWDGFRRTRKEPKEETEAEREAKLKKERDRKAAARAKSKSSESDDSHVSASADVRACPGLSGLSGVSAAVRRADSVSGVSVQQEIERRGDREEREEEQDVSGKPDAAALLALTACEEINRAAGTRYHPDSKSVRDPCRKLAKNKHTADDVRRVVALKRPWLDDAKMREHFRPSTLLRPSNFEKYLDELDAAPLFAQGTHTMRIVSPDDDEPDLTYAGCGIGAVT